MLANKIRLLLLPLPPLSKYLLQVGLASCKALAVIFVGDHLVSSLKSARVQSQSNTSAQQAVDLQI